MSLLPKGRCRREMSLLPKGPRSDTALHVMGAAVVHVYSDGAATVAYHIRLPKAMYGSKLEGMLEQLISSARFQQDVRWAVRRTCNVPASIVRHHANNLLTSSRARRLLQVVAKGRMTVDDSSIGLDVAVHCYVTESGLIVMACTRQDYPTRVVFPRRTADLSAPSGLLGRLSDVANEDIGTESFVAAGRGAPGTIRRIQLAERVSGILERVCADFEDKGAHDPVARVQAEVDEARNVMQGNISAMLANQEQLTALQSKTDDIAHDSRDFYRDARTSRRQMQCAEYRNRLIAIVAGTVLLLWIFGGWIFGTDEHHMRLHIPPSPPPPSDV